MKCIKIDLIKTAARLAAFFCFYSSLAIAMSLVPATDHEAEQASRIIRDLRVQDFPTTESIWDRNKTDYDVKDLVAASALLWGLNQLKDNRIAAQNLTPLPAEVTSIDAWEDNARLVNAQLRDRFWWIEIELAEEKLGITNAHLLPFGDRPEEAYALRTLFPRLYAAYIAEHK